MACMTLAEAVLVLLAAATGLVTLGRACRMYGKCAE
jgi:hypothetical protein